MSEPRTIDLTPAGCQTPDGIARANAALRAVDQANAECARLLDELHNDCAHGTIRETWLEMRDDIVGALRDRAIANEEFLRALSNAPAASRKGEE